jgi:hypothetical protein
MVKFKLDSNTLTMDFQKDFDLPFFVQFNVLLPEFWSSTLVFNILTLRTRILKKEWNLSLTLAGKENMLIDLKLI